MNAKSTKKTGTKTSTKATAKAGKPTPPVPASRDNILRRVEPGQFADALNKATVAELQDALKLECWSAKQRGRIEAALKTRVTPAPTDEVAKTVATVEKGVEVPTAGKKKATAKAAKPEGKMSGLDAAAKVLAEAGQPLNAKQIVEAMAAKSYWSSNAATPHATIYAGMIVEIAKKGDLARFKKADRGLFTVTTAAKQAK